MNFLTPIDPIESNNRFDSSMGGLTVAEQFLMISTKLATKYLYGMGENNHDTFVHNMSYKTWPIFARDQPPDYVNQLKLHFHSEYYCWRQHYIVHGLVASITLIDSRVITTNCVVTINRVQWRNAHFDRFPGRFQSVRRSTVLHGDWERRLFARCLLLQQPCHG